MTYARTTLPIATPREYGGAERTLPPGAPEQVQPEAEVADAVPHTAVRESEQQAFESLAKDSVLAEEAAAAGLSIVPAHTVVSRACVESDVPRIARDAFLMRKLFFGVTTAALAHSQVTDKDPLRFFVTAGIVFPKQRSAVVINPAIVMHSGYTVDSKEGCHTWDDREHVIVQRWRKCEVTYQQFGEDGKLSDVIEDSCVGFAANVFQHELDHLNAKYIYPI